MAQRLLLLVLAGLLAGCATTAPLQDCTPVLKPVVEPKATCERDPNRPPGCIRGVFVGASCRF